MKSAPRPWAPAAVVLLTIVWVVALLALTWWLFGIGMERWANSYDSDRARAAELARQSSRALLILAAVAVGGPILIAIVARAGELVRTGVVYIVLAIVLGLLVLPVAAGAYRTVTPPPPPPAVPDGCQERSGGDTRCPGG
ncbi:MAG TPA: DUF6234 family protein [Micromonosporaceae bacterium]|nr:DUF6234 family protein [Micromonosporaceae bacterium]